MAITRERRRIFNQNIGVVRADTGSTKVWANVAANAGIAAEYDYKVKSAQAKQAGIDRAWEISREEIINFQNGRPEAFSFQKNFGRIQSESFRNVIDKRFVNHMKDELIDQSQDIARRTNYDPDAYELHMGEYLKSMGKASKGFYHGVIADTGYDIVQGTVTKLRAAQQSRAIAAATTAAKENKQKAKDDLNFFAKGTADEVVVGHATTDPRQEELFSSHANVGPMRLITGDGIIHYQNAEDEFMQASLEEFNITGDVKQFRKDQEYVNQTRINIPANHLIIASRKMTPHQRDIVGAALLEHSFVPDVYKFSPDSHAALVMLHNNWSEKEIEEVRKRFDSQDTRIETLEAHEKARAEARASAAEVADDLRDAAVISYIESRKDVGSLLGYVSSGKKEEKDAALDRISELLIEKMTFVDGEDVDGVFSAVQSVLMGKPINELIESRPEFFVDFDGPAGQSTLRYRSLLEDLNMISSSGMDFADRKGILNDFEAVKKISKFEEFITSEEDAAATMRNQQWQKDFAHHTRHIEELEKGLPLSLTEEEYGELLARLATVNPTDLPVELYQDWLSINTSYNEVQKELAESSVTEDKVANQERFDSIYASLSSLTAIQKDRELLPEEINEINKLLSMLNTIDGSALNADSKKKFAEAGHKFEAARNDYIERLGKDISQKVSIEYTAEIDGLHMLIDETGSSIEITSLEELVEKILDDDRLTAADRGSLYTKYRELYGKYMRRIGVAEGNIKKQEIENLLDLYENESRNLLQQIATRGLLRVALPEYEKLTGSSSVSFQNRIDTVDARRSLVRIFERTGDLSATSSEVIEVIANAIKRPELFKEDNAAYDLVMNDPTAKKIYLELEGTVDRLGAQAGKSWRDTFANQLVDTHAAHRKIHLDKERRIQLEERLSSLTPSEQNEYEKLAKFPPMEDMFELDGGLPVMGEQGLLVPVSAEVALLMKAGVLPSDVEEFLVSVGSGVIEDEESRRFAILLARSFSTNRNLALGRGEDFEAALRRIEAADFIFRRGVGVGLDIAFEYADQDVKGWVTENFGDDLSPEARKALEMSARMFRGEELTKKNVVEFMRTSSDGLGKDPRVMSGMIGDGLSLHARSIVASPSDIRSMDNHIEGKLREKYPQFATPKISSYVKDVLGALPGVIVYPKDRDVGYERYPEIDWKLYYIGQGNYEVRVRMDSAPIYTPIMLPMGEDGEAGAFVVDVNDFVGDGRWYDNTMLLKYQTIYKTNAHNIGSGYGGELPNSITDGGLGLGNVSTERWKAYMGIEGDVSEADMSKLLGMEHAYHLARKHHYGAVQHHDLLKFLIRENFINSKDSAFSVSDAERYYIHLGLGDKFEEDRLNGFSGPRINLLDESYRGVFE